MPATYTFHRTLRNQFSQQKTSTKSVMDPVNLSLEKQEES